MTLTRNPEDDVCDAIAELVDESLARGPTDDYRRPFSRRCELCGDEWHGLTGDGDVAGVQGCPGAYASDEQAQTWREWWDMPKVFMAQQEMLGQMLLGGAEAMNALNEVVRDINERMARFP